MMCGILCLYNQQRNVLDDCGKFNKMLHLFMSILTLYSMLATTSWS